jgi:hypothetical protein
MRAGGEAAGGGRWRRPGRGPAGPAAGARARLWRPAPGSAPYVGAVSGVVLMVAVFLPWYATNLGPPFASSSASGWEATGLARAALGLAVVLTVAAAALALEARGGLALTYRQADALSWAVLGAAAVAGVLVGIRLVAVPEPAELLSRQIGLYLAMAGAVGGVLSGLALLSSRD